MRTNEEIIAAQDEDIKNLVKQVQDLTTLLDDVKESCVFNIDPAVIKSSFKVNYFYFGQGYIYRCHLMAITYNMYSNKFEARYTITGMFTIKTKRYDYYNGHRNFKSVYNYTDALTLLSKRLKKAVAFNDPALIDHLNAANKFIMYNRDFTNNRSFDEDVHQGVIHF